MAIGRKATGREILVRDEDPEMQNRGTHGGNPDVFEVQVREEKGTPWWRRLWSRRDSIDSFESDGKAKGHAAPMVQRRTGPPNLTIETNIMPPKSQRDRYPIIVQDELQAEPAAAAEPLTSAWSISPDAKRPTPWTRPLPANTLPLQPKPRLQLAPSQSIHNAFPRVLNVTLPTAAVPPVTGSVPIHHGFVRPIPKGTPSSPSPPASPTVVHSASLTLASPPQMNQVTISNPSVVGNTHARTSSRAIVDNPFATCFDDEHGVNPGTEPPAKRISTTNPFADIGTPRAV